jgi:hypothetical protein
MPGRDEALIPSHGHQSREIRQDPPRRVAPGQVGEHLGGDGPVVVVLVPQLLDQIVPHFVSPIHRLLGGFQYKYQGCIAIFALCLP